MRIKLKTRLYDLSDKINSRERIRFWTGCQFFPQWSLIGSTRLFLLFDTIANPKMHVLLTNDDGIHAEGLWAVSDELQRDSRVSRLDIIAPAVQQSGVSHSITYLTPLTPTRTTVREQQVWIVNGTPADCVKLGVMSLLDRRPDVVISGINEGLNTGINAIYSGTVAAAREATFFDIPAAALSLEYAHDMDFHRASLLSTGRTLGLLKELRGQESGKTLLNVNIPTSAVILSDVSDEVYWKIVPMKLTRSDDPYTVGQNPKQGNYYWSTDQPFVELPGADTDVDSIAGGAITVTPMSFDLTNHRVLRKMQSG